MAKHDAITWSDKLQDAVIADIESGKPLRATAENNGMSAASILNRVIADEVFAKRYAHAKQIQIEQFADQIITLADSADSENYNVARLQVDTRKWLLSKLIPKKYGDKVEQFISGPEGKPIEQSITLNFVSPKPPSE